MPFRARFRRTPRLTRALAAALAALALLAALAPLPSADAEDGFEAGERVMVSADGDCLKLRSRPTLQGALLNCIADGTILTALGQNVSADGYRWEQTRVGGQVGWMAGEYLVRVDDPAPPAAPDPTPDPTPKPTPTATPTPTPTPATPNALTAPPPGGFTMGPVGAADLDAFIKAQEFEVAAVWLFRTAEQDFLGHFAGAPAFVNTLDDEALTPGSVVVVSRAGGGARAAVEPLPRTSGPVTGTPNVLPWPPPGGLTIGVSGTNDPATLAAAQEFDVRLITTLDVPSQRWLTYVPGAPAVSQTLGRDQLSADSVVWMRARKITTVHATLSYYYCNQGSIGASIGDGGGFCGYMANGERVHAGAAACARELRGQRFRIEGDPRGLTYTCKDTGSAVRGNHRDIWFDNSDDGYRWIVSVGYTADVHIITE